jgi:hypothetical protein
VNTLIEAIEYLRRLGLYACKRSIGLDPAVFVGTGVVRSGSGMISFRRGLYIQRWNHSRSNCTWSILDLSRAVPESAQRFSSLQEACDAAVTLLEHRSGFKIRVMA